jgi:hypothetical protein
MGTEHIKVFTGTSIIVNGLKNRLQDKGINSIIKDGFQSSKMAGFGAPMNSVELLILQSDTEMATPVINDYVNEINL